MDIKLDIYFTDNLLDSYNSSLQIAFDYFKTNQITDLILDLRYNPGGQQLSRPIFMQYCCTTSMW